MRISRLFPAVVEAVARHIARSKIEELDSDTYLNALRYQLERGEFFPGHFCLLVPIEMAPKIAARALFQLLQKYDDEQLAGRCLSLLLAIRGTNAVHELTALLSSGSYKVRRAAAVQLAKDPDGDWDGAVVRSVFYEEKAVECKSSLLDLLASRPDELPDFEAEAELWNGLLTSSHRPLQISAVNAVVAGGQKATSLIRVLLLLERRTTDSQFRRGIVTAIGSALTDQSRAVKRLIRVINDHDTEVALAAMAILPRLGDYAQQAVGALTLELFSPNLQRQEAARKALKEIGWQPPEETADGTAPGPLAAIVKLLLPQPCESAGELSALACCA